MSLPTNIPILDFLVIDTHDPKYLGIADISRLPLGFTVVSPTIEITPPSFPPVLLPHNLQNLSVYNANVLNLSCVDNYGELPELPDGLWNIKISVAPSHKYFAEKSFFRIDSLIDRWQKALLKTDIKECDQSIKRQDRLALDDIYSFMEGAVAAANQCDYKRAVELYDLALTLLKNFEKSKTC